jgi:hypothetical protein
MNQSMLSALFATLAILSVGCAADDARVGDENPEADVTSDEADLTRKGGGGGGGAVPGVTPDYKIFVRCSVQSSDASNVLLETSSPTMTVATQVPRGKNVDLVVTSTRQSAQFSGSVPGLVNLNVSITNHRDVALKVVDVQANKTMSFTGPMELSPTRHGQILDFAPAFTSSELRGFHLQCIRN